MRGIRRRTVTDYFDLLILRDPGRFITMRANDIIFRSMLSMMELEGFGSRIKITVDCMISDHGR